MKIKTITCHDVYNVGASLQAYALMTYLSSLGHEVEIIDYKPEYLSRHYRLTGVSNPKYDKPVLKQVYNILKFPGRFKALHSQRKKEYDLFKEQYLKVTSHRYTSNEELKKNPPEADVYFAGSDQIWNTKFPNGKDAAFYLDFAPANTIRAAYAASFATEQIEPEYRECVKTWLSNLDYISVRESSGVQIISELGIDNSIQVLDPVFLLNKIEWLKICKKLDLTEKYLLVYDFDNNPRIQVYAQKMAKERNLKIYSVLPCSYCDR